MGVRAVVNMGPCFTTANKTFSIAQDEMDQDKFIAADELLLGDIEEEIYREISDVVESTISKMEALPEDAAESDYDAALGPLNDALASQIGYAMFLHQQDVSTLALRFAAGTMPRMRSPSQLMEAGRISGQTIESHFKRRSPSRFMANLFGQGRKQIEAQVRAAIASGVWAIAGDIQQFTWDAPPKWKWITKQDEMVCGICRPLNGVIFNEPRDKAHWACRCELLPSAG